MSPEEKMLRQNEKREKMKTRERRKRQRRESINGNTEKKSVFPMRYENAQDTGN